MKAKGKPQDSNNSSEPDPGQPGRQKSSRRAQEITAVGANRRVAGLEAQVADMRKQMAQMAGMRKEMAQTVRSAVNQAVANALSQSARRPLADDSQYQKKQKIAEPSQPLQRMCVKCGKGQRGAFCVHRMCRPCCKKTEGADGQHCPQHARQV